MRKQHFTARHALLLLMLTTCALPGQAQTAAPIGTVIFASGEVQARSMDGRIRTLTRRDPVFAHDTLIVGASGVVHLRMVDSAT
ncbi:MAG: hypothetical protein LBF16_00935, partial [Pseudomonadales bacterium]|nr:hypothetical protein [Pseudomonadales bacterium]